MFAMRFHTWSGSRHWFTSTGAALVIFGIAFLTLSGCSEQSTIGGYDPSLRYPLRDDALIVKLPEEIPTKHLPHGDPDANLAKFPEQRGIIRPVKTLPEEARTKLANALEVVFGTPAHPKVPTSYPHDSEELAKGSRVYSRICRNCHGLSGDSRGAGGLYMTPAPRDFRLGLFQTALGDNKPRFDDLVQVVKHGVPGSTMQAFDLIPENDLRAATLYTVHLSIRGEVEQKQLFAMIEDDFEPSTDLTASVAEQAERIAKRWLAAEQVSWPEVQLNPTEESIRRGLELFTKQGCNSCHVDFGRKETYRYNLWGGVSRVADLTRGEFRWGKSPDRLAARIRHGIPAVGMPAHDSLNQQQLHDLTCFVKEMSLPDRLPADVRLAVHPESK